MIRPSTPGPAYLEKSGLAYWMARVLKEREKAERKHLDPDAVHDLRVALRRCRSMAESLMALDPDPAWRDMKKSAGRLFKPLGELRDIQVAAGWLKQLAPPEDLVRQRLLDLLAQREAAAKSAAGKALSLFDARQWRRLARTLPGHSRRLPLDGRVFQHIAVERFTEAYALHRRAARTRSQIALHRLRIGVKKFRYVVENFLPALHAEIGASLKRVQDLLGEVHDLDVLQPLLREAGDLYTLDARALWRERIAAERRCRITEYRSLAAGQDSLWAAWREKLPQGRELDAAAFAKLRAWASFLDPDIRGARHRHHLALQLFDGLAAAGVNPIFGDPRARRIVAAAALLGNVGRVEGHRGHHKTSYRLIREFPRPLGWSPSDMLWTALVARYHRGTDPQEKHEGYALLSPQERRDLTWLAATVRLADAFVGIPHGHVARLTVESSGGIHVWTQGYTAHPDWAARVEEKQRLLELVSARTVFVRPACQPAVKARAHAAAG
jgi:exopolyphosphatase/guanosine-5'-triphosphate,3'-diphosphate pyrophosphatase